MWQFTARNRNLFVDRGALVFTKTRRSTLPFRCQARSDERLVDDQRRAKRETLKSDSFPRLAVLSVEPMATSTRTGRLKRPRKAMRQLQKLMPRKHEKARLELTPDARLYSIHRLPLDPAPIHAPTRSIPPQSTSIPIPIAAYTSHTYC